MTQSPAPVGIEHGDALARGGQWRAAVSCWLDHWASPASITREAAESRLRWMLEQPDAVAGARTRREDRRRGAYRILFVAILLGAVATALVIAGMRTESGASVPLAGLAWVVIAAALACAALFALRLGSADAPVPLTLEEIAGILRTADALDRQVARETVTEPDREATLAGDGRNSHAPSESSAAPTPIERGTQP